jgi:hypothetical protein
MQCHILRTFEEKKYFIPDFHAIFPPRLSAISEELRISILAPQLYTQRDVLYFESVF